MVPLSLYLSLQEPVSVPEENRLRELFDQLLTFLYSAAHWFGQLTVSLIRLILGDTLPQQTFDGLVDPIGFLILLTVFLAIAEVAKRIAWLVVIVGWALIVIRIAIEVLGTGTGAGG